MIQSLSDAAADGWPGLTLEQPVEEGNRNEVWRGELDGVAVAVRRSRRAPSSLDWELELLTELGHRGFQVPLPVPSAAGALSHEGVVVQQWIDGRPPSTDSDWRAVADELQRLHRDGPNVRQRPGCVTATELTRTARSVDADMSVLPNDVAARVLAVFESMGDVPTSLIHGDPAPSNIRMTPSGVALLDWDESRVDLSWHDLSNLGVVVLDANAQQRAENLSNAWEAANAWTVEPEYARSRLADLSW